MKPKNRNQNEISRRDFIKAAGVGAVALTGFASNEARGQVRSELSWDREADVLVVGSGATGIPAAIEAREAGATVVVIEANFDVGGHAALSGGNVALGGGPIWAIFDAEAATREKWTVAPPQVDTAAGFFFSAPSIEDLARAIVNKYQKKPMPSDQLEKTVTNNNSYVDVGKDPDFDKPTPKYKIQTPPFYGAWATPVLHDTRAGLRINTKCQVMDFNGNVIPGLYCGGESAGGFSMHGLARCIVQGRIAGKNAAAETQVAVRKS